MSLIYKQGSIINALKNGEIEICAIQENCTVGMGAGISKFLVDEYPEIRKYNLEQLKLAKTAPEEVLGKAIPYLLNNNAVIYGIYSQYYPGGPSIDGFDKFEQRLHWLNKGLSYINDSNKGKSIILPLIASGLAKMRTKDCISDLDYFKKYIAPTVEECLIDMNVTVYYL